MASNRVERKLAAIMFTDIVGYAALMAQDEETGSARDRHEAGVRPLIERYHGEWVERTGDETLSSFPSAPMRWTDARMGFPEEYTKTAVPNAWVGAQG